MARYAEKLCKMTKTNPFVLEYIGLRFVNQRNILVFGQRDAAARLPCFVVLCVLEGK